MVTEPEFESPEEEVSADEFPPEEQDVMDDATLVMGDDTQHIQKPEGAPPQVGQGPVQGLPTEEIDASFADSMVTEAMPNMAPDAHASPSAESDEVFVLLPDEEIPVVEAIEVDDGGYDGLATESIADAILKDVNPLNDSGVYSDEPEYVDMGDGVGVIDEIAELASALDEDILTADEADEDGDYFSEEGVYQEYEDAGEFEERKSRAPVLVAAALLALVSLGGVYFFVVRQQGPVDSGSTVIAQGGNTGVEVSDGENGTDIDVATTGGTDPVDGMDPELGGQTELAGASGIEEGFSPTRVAVREQVQLVMKLGLQWEPGEDN